MRYLLSPNEEFNFLRRLKREFQLVPLTPSDSHDFPGALEICASPSPGAASSNDDLDYIFWAKDHGPITRIGDGSGPKDGVARVVRILNRDAKLEGTAIDLETTPIVSWTRPRWYQGNRQWIVPSRLGSTRTTRRDFTPAYAKMFSSIEALLRRNGEKVNSWDIPNSRDDTGLEFTAPKNTASFNVVVWPEAFRWLEKGVKIYHWDA
ncbi:hypothetical protein [Sulfitobacter aestuariivivens]|uniref:Uncharacterized protein n=1 Tax=Sulfitobacter aestuariivivens TaxID=2766981 RepID=A0A927D0P1_9RHOB|nr:hypothetical protein [Sulfitobacter aestuariivivens]MBD3662910.1 hypothetical protein [Sulfitobacter aestuariivivens]